MPKYTKRRGMRKQRGGWPWDNLKMPSFFGNKQQQEEQEGYGPRQQYGEEERAPLMGSRGPYGGRVIKGGSTVRPFSGTYADYAPYNYKAYSQNGGGVPIPVHSHTSLGHRHHGTHKGGRRRKNKKTRKSRKSRKSKK